MIVLLLGVLCPKNIVWDQMFIDVEIIWHTKLLGKFFYIKKIDNLE